MSSHLNTKPFTPSQEARNAAGLTVAQAAARLPRFLRVCDIATFRQYEREGFPEKWAIGLAAVYGCLPMMLSRGRHQSIKQRRKENGDGQSLHQSQDATSSSLRRTMCRRPALTTKKKAPVCSTKADQGQD